MVRIDRNRVNPVPIYPGSLPLFWERSLTLEEVIMNCRDRPLGLSRMINLPQIQNLWEVGRQDSCTDLDHRHRKYLRNSETPNW